MQDLFQAATLERSSCAEEAGVDSSVVRSFIEECQESGYNFNNIIIGRYGKVAVECTKKPYDPQFSHTTFSMAKPITAIAVGFAISEGLLHIDTTMGEIFGDILNEKQMSKVADISIEHLLTMTSGKGISILGNKEKGSWLLNFVKGRSHAAPGEKFIYISENTYVLSRMLTEVTGLTVSEYLKPRLFEPLGIKTPFWETDSEGYEAGGWGLYLTIEDMAKIAQCFLDMGKWDSVQVIPSDWIEKMITPKVSDIPSLYAKGLGFGYQIWSSYDGTYYRFEGLFGQYIFVYPKHNAYIVMNSGDVRQYIIYPLIDKYFPAAFKTPSEFSVTNEKINEFNKFMDSIWYPVLRPGPRNFASEAGLSGKTYKFIKNQYASLQSTSVAFVMAKRPGCMNDLCFVFHDGFAEMFWSEKNYGKNKLFVSLDGKKRISEVTLGDNPIHMVSYGKWLQDGRLKIQIIPMEVPEVKTMVLKFIKNKVKIKMSVRTNLREMILFKFRFQGYKVNKMVEIIAKLGGSVGSILLYPKSLYGRLKKNK